MFLLKRLLLAMTLSACSESAIAQETPRTADRNEPSWVSPGREQVGLGNANDLSVEEEPAPGPDAAVPWTGSRRVTELEATLDARPSVADARGRSRR